MREALRDLCEICARSVRDLCEMVIGTHRGEQGSLLERAQMCPTQRGPRDWPNGAIGAEATLDLEELHGLLGERAEVAVDLESPCACGEGRTRRRGEHLHARHVAPAVLESPCTEEDVEALLQEDDRLPPGVPNHKGRFDEISDR
jgi:hypothetical protein